jgi:hypothetical protein
MNIIANIPQVTRAASIDSRMSGRIWQDGKYRTLGNIGHGTQALSRDQLRQCAPSIFADAAHSRTSQRYSFLPTASILDGMEAEGWVPTLVQEQNVRDESREGFQKHMIRFAHRDDLQLASTDRPEIVLINAHDRSSAYQLHCGIFRTYCLMASLCAMPPLPAAPSSTPGLILPRSSKPAWKSSARSQSSWTASAR